jgi:hypothetical protein
MNSELKYAVKEYNCGKFVCAGGPLSLDGARKVATCKATILNLHPADDMTWGSEDHVVCIVGCPEHVL